MKQGRCSLTEVSDDAITLIAPGEKGVRRDERETNLQIRARMSPLPVANKPPIGLGATEITAMMHVLADGWHALIDERSK